MTRLRRRMLFGITIAVFIVVGLVLFFYRPTRLALERAEAFQFRRMLVTKLSDQEAYRFFYVTNRQYGEQTTAPWKNALATSARKRSASVCLTPDSSPRWVSE